MRHRKTVTIVKATLPEDNVFLTAKIVEDNKHVNASKQKKQGKDFAKFLFENSCATWLDAMFIQLQEEYNKLYGNDYNPANRND